MSTKDTNPKDSIGTRKAPLSTVPMNVIAEIGVAMLEGAAKYGRHNYRAAGIRNSVYFDAAMRHLIAWWEGEDIDPDSGMSHITKALATLVVLRDGMLAGNGTDDRPPPSRPFYGDLNTRAVHILDRHQDKSPVHYTRLTTGQHATASGSDALGHPGPSGGTAGVVVIDQKSNFPGGEEHA